MPWIERLQKLWTYTTAIGLLSLFFFILILLPILIPLVVAKQITDMPPLMIAIGVFFYFLIWLFAFVMTVDSGAYIYGYRRPFLTGIPGFRIRLSQPNIRTRIGFVLTCLTSYGLTLYGFAVSYIVVSQRDPTSFLPPQPLGIISSIYFTIVTAATVGYGDIVPRSRMARILVSSEITLSFLYVIFLFSTLSGLARSTSTRQSNQDDNST